MARVVGFTEQQNLTPVYRADGTVAAGGTAQLFRGFFPRLGVEMTAVFVGILGAHGALIKKWGQG